jgi:hypothetical protein
MNVKRKWLAAVACGALATAATAAEPRIGKFMSYEANGFTVITSRSPGQAKQVIEDLGKFRYTLEKSLGRRSTNTAIPTQIVIVSAADWGRYLEPRQNVSGWFQQGAFANYLTMNGDAERWIAISVIFHEYTHYYLASQFAGEYPPWFNEGLAEVMGYAKFMDRGELKGMAVLQVPMYRLEEARHGDWIPFERMLKVDHYSPEYQSHKLAASFYAQAWLTVHYGLVENRPFGRQLIDYLNLLNTLVPQEEAATRAFVDLGAADKLLRDYSRNPRLSSGAIRLGDLPVVTLPAPKPVSETDALAIMINLMIETRMAPDRTRPLVEALLRREPKAARSHIFAARLALQDDDPTAFEKAVTQADAALAPDDWLQRRELASVLLESNTGYRALSARHDEDSERDLKRAFKWYAEGLAKTNEDIELLWGFGTAATRLNRDLDLAEKALTLAYKKAPSNANIAISLANLKGRQEDYEGMILYLQDAERFATNIGMRQWATSTLVDMRKYVAERKAFEEEDRKQREAYEKQLADYEKKYGKQKKKKP